MAYFFPEKMTYCQALVPTEIAWEVLDQLGEQQKIAFESNLINYESPFIKNYRRSQQLLTKVQTIRGMLQQCKKWLNFQVKQVKNNAPVWRSFRKLIQQQDIEGYLFINQIEEEVFNTHGYLSHQLAEVENLSKKADELVIEMSLLVTMEKYDNIQFLQGGHNPLYESFDEKDRSTMFETKCVGVKRKDLLMVKRSIFRITRGNCWVNELDISLEDINRYLTSRKHRLLAEEALKNYVACLIVFPKGQRNIALTKLDRLLSCLDCHVISQDSSNFKRQLQRKEQKINDIESMEDLTLEGIRKHISKLSEVRDGGSGSWICQLELFAKKEREIYRALSTAQVSKSLARFRLYIPTRELPLIIQPNRNLPPLTLNIVESNKMPPSKFDTNCMLKVPQQIVNTYGVPSYTEINPAPFYIVTFGFFIGVMFGDVGHMLLAIPLLLQFKANIWFWTVIFFMGYCGLIYNQFFGLNLGLLSSCYTIVESQTNSYVEHLSDCIYPLGIDSIWKVSFNQMSFTNSLKMKMAVIFGVTHMMLGLFLRLYNNIRQSKWVDLLTLTIPQLVFMSCTFVYMDYIIIYKWGVEWTDTSKAPSVISTMIAVFVNMAKSTPGQLLFWPTQRSFEKSIVIIALLCVPIMLLGKTLVIYCQRKKRDGMPPQHDIQMDELAEENDTFDIEGSPNEKSSHEELKNTTKGKIIKQNEEQEEPINQIAVHQFIETIEFVLGSVSNTASYLRLWALSLAHAQLSAVIFQLTVLRQLQKGYSGLVGLFLIFPFYLATTFGVLICMDSLECFLHSLRLHWVEFQNKFYEGKGYLFNAFSFRKLK